MRMQLLKIVVVLLVAGSGDTRPQNGADSQAKTIERNDAGWRSIQVSSKSHDIVRDDSRYTGTSGSNRKYITHFRDIADSSGEHNAVNSRASNFAAARSLSVRRSKIDDIWTMPKFRAINAPPYFSRTDVLGNIAKFATVVQNSNDINKSSFHASSGNSKIIPNERINWTRFSSNSKVSQTDYSGKMNAENLERSKSGVISNENLEPIVAQTKYSYSTGNDFLATHASGLERTNDDISVAVENRRKSSSVRFDSLNKDIEGEMSRWKQGVNRFSLQIARTNVPSDSQANASTHSIHKDRNSIRKPTNSSVISHGNSKPSVVTNSSRSNGDQQGDLNNSERSTHGVEAALIPNLKSEVVSQFPAFRHRNAATSHRNFVKLRYPYSTSNWRNASNVALNMKVKNGNDISTDIQLRKPAKHFTRTGAKKPVSLNTHVTSKPMKSNYSSSVQESPSQKVGTENKTVDKYNDTTVQYDAYLKNWPNDPIQNFEDLYNYEKYTSSLEKESSHESSLSSAEETPILLSNNYFDHADPILDSSVKKIIHWLKVPEIVPNNTQYFDYNDDKPIESNLESVYENLEPNRPLNTHDDNYETVVLQDVPSQNLDTIDSNYPIRWSDPTSITSFKYETDSSNPPAPLLPSWLDEALQNKTVYNPTTHVTQNTVVHILNDGLKKPNVTVTQLKTPEIDATAANQATSLESSSESLAQRPNVHVMFTSQNDENKNISKQETDTFPSSTYNTNCPTIMINTYTRVNNTLQSKEGCTDLNIIVNSHVLNTNVFKPSSAPATAEDQQTSLATQNYGSTDESEKYSDLLTDLSHVDSLGSYVTASTGTYGSNLLEILQPDQHDYYDSEKDPSEILDPAQSLGLSTIDSLHTVEVSQGTQISVSLANAEESSADGPGNDASSSAINPPAAGASVSGPPVAGTLGSENPSVLVAQELPVYLVKPGSVTGQSNVGPGSLQLSALPNLPSLNIATKPGLSSSAGSSLSPALGSSGALPDGDDDDDDDFDFDFDMSPGDVLQYMAKAFTYFSFLNPLGYGVVSLTSAPFVAMAAGILGIAAFIFPWALPSAFEFGRSADKTIGFTPNLEEFVRQAVHKYDRLNEWKSRRRKRRR